MAVSQLQSKDPEAAKGSRVFHFGTEPGKKLNGFAEDSKKDKVWSVKEEKEEELKSFAAALDKDKVWSAEETKKWHDVLSGLREQLMKALLTLLWYESLTPSHHERLT